MGCGTTHTITTNTPINIDNKFFECVETVPRPVSTVDGVKVPVMESEVATYIASLERANLDCRTKMKMVKEIISCYNDKTCDVNKKILALGVEPGVPEG